MDVFLDAQAVFLLSATADDVLPEKGAQDEQVEEIGPCRTVPGAVDDDGELPLGRWLAVALGLDPETVGARGQMGERDLVDTGLEAVVGLTIDAV